MRLILHELRTRLRYKIIVPFLLLTLCVALAGSAIAFSLVAGSWQERFDNQLAQVTRVVSDGLVDQERANLTFLQEVAFAPRNTTTGAPAIAEALAASDVPGLDSALEPYFRVGTQRSSVRLDRLIAFDRSGTTRFDWERPSGSSTEDYTRHAPLDLSRTWLVPSVLKADQDLLGDKFAGLLLLPDTNAYYIATIAPVRQGNEIVGGVIVAMRVDSLMEALRQRSQAAVVALYDGSGKALYSTTAPLQGIGTLDMSPQVLQQLQTNTEAGRAIFDVPINARTYQFAYSSLTIRDATVGIMAVSLSRDYVLNAWGDARRPMAILTISLMIAIIALGVYIAQLITAPLQELVRTAHAVTAGDLERRSVVHSNDEVGLLSHSFNSMTEHLLRLYDTVRAESRERAAIIDSIVDGVVMCEQDGRIRYANRVMRLFLNLADDQPLPERFSDLPLERLPEAATFAERRVSNLFSLNERVVRISAAPVLDDDGTRLGSVCVLQDMTDEVAIDRAKTNFIATISHELRTPLTVIRGNGNLLIRGLVGALQPEQRGLVETMRAQAINMSSLINNVIVIAGIDSGSLTTDLEPTNLERAVEEILWPIRSQITAKGLSLELTIGPEIPLVYADSFQLRTVLTQLLDNAQRYTSEGGIVVRAASHEKKVQIDVCDTGRGIPPSLHEHLFRRFMRGDGADQGINSSERGIGLGLAIVKQLVERQGGEVWVTETSEAGTILSFTLLTVDENRQYEHSEHNQALHAAA